MADTPSEAFEQMPTLGSDEVGGSGIASTLKLVTGLKCFCLKCVNMVSAIKMEKKNKTRKCRGGGGGGTLDTSTMFALFKESCAPANPP